MWDGRQRLATADALARNSGVTVMQCHASKRDLIRSARARDSVLAATTTVVPPTAPAATARSLEWAVGMLSTARKDDESVLPAGKRALMRKLLGRLANAK